jgi:hypothetical protein
MGIKKQSLQATPCSLVVSCPKSARDAIQFAHIAMTGCGRFFEGTAEEMHLALNKHLASLPDDTVVFVSRCQFCIGIRLTL